MWPALIIDTPFQSDHNVHICYLNHLVYTCYIYYIDGIIVIVCSQTNADQSL